MASLASSRECYWTLTERSGRLERSWEQGATQLLLEAAWLPVKASDSDALLQEKEGPEEEQERPCPFVWLWAVGALKVEPALKAVLSAAEVPMVVTGMKN